MHTADLVVNDCEQWICQTTISILPPKEDQTRGHWSCDCVCHSIDFLVGVPLEDELLCQLKSDPVFLN